MENHLEAECEYELEAIKKRRINSLTGEREFYVQWKDYGPEACSWVSEANLENAPDMLADFNQLADMQAQQAEKTSSHRQRPAVLIAHEDAPTPVKRRRHGPHWKHHHQHQALRQQVAAAAAEPKQRHTSASSVERTPEYLEVRKPHHQQQTARRPKPSLTLEKQLELQQQQQQRRRQKEKLHLSSKEIEAVGMLRRNCGPDHDRPTGPIGRVATRKAAPQLEQPTAPPLLHQREPPTLAELLSQPPESKLSAVADAVVALGCSQPAESSAMPAPTDLKILRLLVCGKGPGGTSGDPDSLADALRHQNRPQLLDAPLDDNHQTRLVHLAATAGPKAPQLLLVLLVAGAAPDVQDARGRTPLMLAAQAGNADAVQRLLEFGAWPDTANKDCTALTAAAGRGNWSAVAVLLRHGAQFAGLARLPGFDAAQLQPWTDRLAQPLAGTLLRRLRASDFPRLPPYLVDCQPPYLSAVSRAGLRSFTFALPARAASPRAAHLLVTAVAELDGQGGVQLRRVDSSPLARVTVNGQLASQLAAVTSGPSSLAIFPLEGLAQDNKLLLAFRGDLPPDRCRVKLVAQVVTLVATGNVPVPG